MASVSSRASPLLLVLILLAVALLLPGPGFTLAQTPSTCASSYARSDTGCGAYSTTATCCSVLRTELYLYPGCYCIKDLATASAVAARCGFTIPSSVPLCSSTSSPSVPATTTTTSRALSSLSYIHTLPLLLLMVIAFIGPFVALFSTT